MAIRRDDDMDVDRSESGEDMDMSDEDARLPQSEAPVDEEGSSATERDALSEEDPPEEGSDQNGESESEPEVFSEDGGPTSAEEEEEEKEQQEDELSPTPSQASPSPPIQSSPPKKPRFKITLKLPSMPGMASTNATPTPSDVTQPPSRRSRDIDIESEDSDDDEVAGPSRMTHRQAAMAGVVNAEKHVSLEEPVSKRKKHLNESELALRREETARKRRNLSEKKLEDEKAETINRLLKKQSRSRTKRTAQAAADAEEEADVDGEESLPAAQAPAAPTLFRWVSSTKSGTQALSFSIPAALLPEAVESGQGNILSSESMEHTSLPETRALPICDIPGCTLPRKYKLVKDPVKGGCGMVHLKALTVGQSRGSS